MAPASRPTATSLDVSAIPTQAAGAGRYVVELVRALGGRPDVELTLTCRQGDDARWAALAPGARLFDRVPPQRPLRVAYEQWVLGGALRRLRRPDIAVHHGPHYTFPHHLDGIGSVVTIHDLTFLDHPEWHVAAKVPFFRRAIRRAARAADVVVCVSDTTAARLRELLPVSGTVLVAPHGVDHLRFRPDAGAAPDTDLLEPLGLRADERYVLHLGTLEPRKGIATLVGAFDRLSERRHDLRLVLAGQDGWGVDEISKAIAASPQAERIGRLGYVDDAAVPALLRSAAAVCYPSFEEGFGLPALEALACGAPLVTTTGTAMAEFAGAAAWTVEAGDATALADALEAALAAPPGELLRRREEGSRRAAAFTWERTAALHAEAYAKAALAALPRRRRSHR